MHLTLVNCLEPVSTTIAAVVGLFSVSYGGYKLAKCKIVECCDDDWIHFDYSGLKQDLQEKVFGQHFVNHLIPPYLKGHLQNRDPKKALVMSFNGLKGCGKNYVSKFIATHLFKKGLESDYYYMFHGDRMNHKSEADSYKESIRNVIEASTKKCDRSLFIFDEVEKMPSGVMDVLLPYIENHYKFNGVNYRKNIFIFLSNVGYVDITSTALQYWSDGKSREDIKLKEIEHSIATSTFNTDGGLKHSEIVKRNLIDVFVPFLPLEKEHVKQCVELEFKRRSMSATKSDVKKIANDLNYFPKDVEIYSEEGCRRIDGRIDLYYG